MLLKSTFVMASCLAILLAATTASHAANLAAPAKSIASTDAGPLITKVHSLGEAEETLSSRGFYDIRVERATLPYSFNACKHGARYHIHVNYYGQIEQVDETGQCGGYSNNDDGDYRPRHHYRNPNSNRYGYNRNWRSGY